MSCSFPPCSFRASYACIPVEVLLSSVAVLDDKVTAGVVGRRKAVRQSRHTGSHQLLVDLGRMVKEVALKAVPEALTHSCKHISFALADTMRTYA